MAKHGRTREAVQEAIRICKEKNVLKEYLSSREKEVVDMLMELYDQEEVIKSYVESEKYEAENAIKMETAKRMLEDGTFSMDKIAKFSDLPIEVVRELAGLQSV